MVNSEIRKLARLSTFLRAYGVVSLLLFPTLLVGFVLQTPLLADPTPAAAAGRLNWVIWNGVVCGGEPCHVPPMLFTIYIVWGVFLLDRREQSGGVHVISDLHDVGQLGTCAHHGRAGDDDAGALLEQMVY